MRSFDRFCVTIDFHWVRLLLTKSKENIIAMDMAWLEQQLCPPPPPLSPACARSPQRRLALLFCALALFLLRDQSKASPVRLAPIEKCVIGRATCRRAMQNRAKKERRAPFWRQRFTNSIGVRPPGPRVCSGAQSPKPSTSMHAYRCLLMITLLLCV